MVNIKEYQEACNKSARVMEDKEKQICFWGLGVAGEAGDVASCIKKNVFHKNEGIVDGIRENVGDMMWYTAMICNFYGWDLSEIMSENLEKLNKRYASGKFTFEEAQRKGTMRKWSGEGTGQVVGSENQELEISNQELEVPQKSMERLTHMSSCGSLEGGNVSCEGCKAEGVGNEED